MTTFQRATRKKYLYKRYLDIWIGRAPDEITISFLTVKQFTVFEVNVIEEVLAFGDKETSILAMAGTWDCLQMFQHVALIAAVPFKKNL